MRVRSLVLIACLATSAGMAQAQSMDPFDFWVSDIILLQAKPIQKDIGVTEAQRGRMNQYASQHQAKVQAHVKELEAKKTPPKDGDPVAVRLFAELKRNVLAQLSPSQLKRLREISLQRIGVSALTDEKVATRVGLSSSQLKGERTAFTSARDQVAAIQRSTASNVMKAYAGRNVKTKAEAERLQKEANHKLELAMRAVAPRLKQIGDGARGKMLALLSPKQRGVWQALLGRPFKA